MRYLHDRMQFDKLHIRKMRQYLHAVIMTLTWVDSRCKVYFGHISTAVYLNNPPTPPHPIPPPLRPVYQPLFHHHPGQDVLSQPERIWCLCQHP